MKNLTPVFFAFLFSFNTFAIRGGTLSDDLIPIDLKKSVVSILKDRGGLKHICTGTIIDRNSILTAAHCFDDKIYKVKIKYKGEVLNISQVQVHKDYSREDILHPHWGFVYDIKISNDIAILKTNELLPKEAINIASSTSPIYRDDNLLISGLGQTANIFGMGTGEGEYRVSLRTNPDEISKERIIIEDGATGGCQGDSGGPLWQEIQGQWLQVGIVSQGDCNVQTQFERINIEKLEKSTFDVFKP